MLNWRSTTITHPLPSSNGKDEFGTKLNLLPDISLFFSEIFKTWGY
jgi:hypothetical protein